VPAADYRAAGWQIPGVADAELVSMCASRANSTPAIFQTRSTCRRDEIESTLPRRVRDKNKVLLLYCPAGRRGAEARKKMIGLGYVNAFNFGSYRRAAQIVCGK